MTGSPPTITVVVPARNAAQTLAATLRSVLCQMSPAERIIVVDDDSIDDTVAVANGFGAAVDVIDGPGRGVSAARNVGLRTASSAYVALLDADDTWDAWLLDEARRLLATHPGVAAIFLSARVVADNGQRIGAHLLPDGAVVLSDLVRGAVVPTTSATIVAREHALSLGGFHERLRAAEDLDLWFRLAQTGRCVSSSRVCATYVVHVTRDRERRTDELAALERDREMVLSRLAERPIERSTLRRGTAIMRARTARYWLLAGRSGEARRIARRGLRAAVTIEGLVTLAGALAPSAAREALRGARRARRARLVR
jgi:glycosyltransferase involved in cell wall biosynthesis